MLRLKYRDQADSPSYLRGSIPTKNELSELLPYLRQHERDELESLISPRSGSADWLPLPGPQTAAFHSKADMLLYGGAAGGGKSDLLLGLSYFKHTSSIVFRREYGQLTAIMERADEVFRNCGRYNGFFRRWIFEDRPSHKLEWGAAENVGTERKFQGRAHDLKSFDEVTHFTRSQFDYLRGWNRTVIAGQHCQTVCTCNPPTITEERWINEYWPNWLDVAKYPTAEVPGKLLWFITRDGVSHQVDGPGRHKFRGKDSLSQSRTFIPSSLKDNLYLDDGQYEAVLESLPEPLRSQLLFGDFQAGVSDDPWQMFPSEWVDAAVKRWSDEFGGKAPSDMFMSQMGVDVARGGQDKTVLSARFGRYYALQSVYKGMQTKDGMQVAGLVLKAIKPNTIVVVDAIGIGASPVDWLRSQNAKVIAFIASGKSESTDRSGYLHFINKRAEAFWRFREALDPQNKVGLALPNDPELIADLCAYTFQVRANGIQVLDKEELRKVLGRSPDKGDSIILAGLPVIPFQFEGIIEQDSVVERGGLGRSSDDGAAGMADSMDAPWNMR